MCNTPSNILVLNRTSPSLLHTFVAYSTQLPIAIQHTGNSFLHQHIPCKRLRASSYSRVVVSYTARNIAFGLRSQVVKVGLLATTLPYDVRN